MNSTVLLGQSDILSLLKRGQLFLNFGAFSFNIHSDAPGLAESLSVLYSDYPGLFDSVSNQFVDFPISLDSPTGLPYWLDRRIQFFFDGFAPFSPFPVQHAPAVIEWGMNWCVSNHINTHLIIHAAVIEKQGYAVVMPAPPGSGKSTLTAALVQEGWRLLSDELTLINPHDLTVTPFPRPISLKNQSIQVINQRYPEVEFGPVSSDTLKGTVCHIKPPKKSIEQSLVTCPIAWIIFPKYVHDSDVQLIEKSKAMTLMDMADNSFNYSKLGFTGFEVLKNIVDQAHCFQFSYGHLDDAINVFRELKAGI